MRAELAHCQAGLAYSSARSTPGAGGRRKLSGHRHRHRCSGVCRAMASAATVRACSTWPWTDRVTVLMCSARSCSVPRLGAAAGEHGVSPHALAHRQGEPVQSAQADRRRTVRVRLPRAQQVGELPSAPVHERDPGLGETVVDRGGRLQPKDDVVGVRGGQQRAGCRSWYPAKVAATFSASGRQCNTDSATTPTGRVKSSSRVVTARSRISSTCRRSASITPVLELSPWTISSRLATATGLRST